MNVVVATLVFGELPYFKYTAAINRRYCDAWGYVFAVMRPPQTLARSPVWYKVCGVKQLLADADYVLFLDGDAYFYDWTQSVEELVEREMGEAAIMLGTDRRDKSFAWSDYNANCGVFLVRHCATAFELLDDWWKSPLNHDRRWLWHWPPEQGAFNAYVKSGTFGASIKLVDYSYLNGADGSFIRHLLGHSDESRLTLLREECARYGVFAGSQTLSVPPTSDKLGPSTFSSGVLKDESKRLGGVK